MLKTGLYLSVIVWIGGEAFVPSFSRLIVVRLKFTDRVRLMRAGRGRVVKTLRPAGGAALSSLRP